VVKRHFPDRVGPVTGLYSMALNLGATTAAAVTVPVALAFGGDWRIGLGVWAVAAVAAVPPWFALARRAAADGSVDPAPGPAPPIARSPTAWALATYFGLQATAAYAIIGWLPQIYRDAGLSAATAGLLFAVTSVLGVPLSLILPAIAGRLRSQSGLAAGLALFGLAAYAGLWAAPAAAPWLWAILLGLLNCSFPLALTMIGMRGRDSVTVGRLSAFAQSVGYLISVPGPIVVGALYERTGDWRTPLAFLTILMVVQVGAGAVAGRDRPVG
jgi:MFS transporter, CP family, cyanate transporter